MTDTSCMNYSSSVNRKPYEFVLKYFLLLLFYMFCYCYLVVITLNQEFRHTFLEKLYQNLPKMCPEKRLKQQRKFEKKYIRISKFLPDRGFVKNFTRIFQKVFLRFLYDIIVLGFPRFFASRLHETVLKAIELILFDTVFEIFFVKIDVKGLHTNDIG